MYYIYHIPNVKIGCSTNPKKRVNQQGYQSFEILETHDCIDSVSVREQELQKEYGYTVDDALYKHSIKNLNYARTKIDYVACGKKLGKHNVESGRWDKVRQIGMIASAKSHKEKRLKRMKELLNIIPTDIFGTRDIKIAGKKINRSKHFIYSTLKEELLVQVIKKGTSKQTPGIYKKINSL